MGLSAISLVELKRTTDFHRVAEAMVEAELTNHAAVPTMDSVSLLQIFARKHKYPPLVKDREQGQHNAADDPVKLDLIPCKTAIELFV